MAYLGQSPVVGRYSLCDDISGSFNGSTTGFSLTTSSSAITPGTAQNLLLSLGGVIQKPGTDYTVSGSNLPFTTAPVAGTTFFATVLGDSYAVGTPSDGTVIPASIASTGDFAFPADVRWNDADASHYVGFQAPSTVSSNIVWTLPSADGSADQVLKTAGNGVLSWTTVSATPEGTAILSTGESGTSKFLRVDGDGTCSWQVPATGLDSDAQKNTVGGTNAGDSFSGTGAEGNTLIGYNVGTAITTGDWNTAIGYDAFKTSETGQYCTAVGFDALRDNTHSYNTALGSYCLTKNTSGQFNHGIGYSCLWSNTTGSNNTAVGDTVLWSNTTASDNTGVGCRALFSNTTGTHNTAVGFHALYTNTTGVENTAVGDNALKSVSASSENTAVGRYAL